MIKKLKRSEPNSSLNEKKQNKWVKEKEAIKMQCELLSVSKEKKMKENLIKMHPNYHQTDCKSLLLFGVKGVGPRYISNSVMVKTGGNT